jgi:hypothetical protein
MKTPRKLLFTGLSILTSLLMVLATGLAAERIETTNRAGIKLSYIPAAKLNDIELRQVLWEAQQVGITNVESVRTVYGIPGLSRHVIVKSKERVNGRNFSYETLSMGRKSWEPDGRKGGVMQASDFRVETSGKQTHFERSYELAGTLRRVAMSEKDVAVADKVIPLVAARKVRFKDESTDTVFNFARHQFERIDLSKPDALRKGSSPDEYELEFSESQHIIYFRYKDGEVLIATVGMYHI